LNETWVNPVVYDVVSSSHGNQLEQTYTHFQTPHKLPANSGVHQCFEVTSPDTSAQEMPDFIVFGFTMCHLATGQNDQPGASRHRHDSVLDVEKS